MEEYDEDWEKREQHRNEHGASSVEYGMLISGIAVLISVAVYNLGPTVAALFVVAWPGG